MKGRVAIVAGGTGALGQSVTSRLISAGATVCVPYAVPAELERLERHLGAAAKQLHARHADVTSESGFGEFVRGVLDAYSRTSVNGVGDRRGDASTSLDEWDRMLTLNLRSTVSDAAGAAGDDRRRVRRIAISSCQAPLPGFHRVHGRQAGVITLTQALAREAWRHHGERRPAEHDGYARQSPPCPCGPLHVGQHRCRGRSSRAWRLTPPAWSRAQPFPSDSSNADR
jgi:NAD(P)-dependent dehydrogenase (short-subunit alcohol dehydrogenase family)